MSPFPDSQAWAVDALSLSWENLDPYAFPPAAILGKVVSLEQILSACHWKSHNTFTQFYLKDVAWADTELFHLGPVVAAQQVHHHAQK